MSQPSLVSFFCRIEGDDLADRKPGLLGAVNYAFTPQRRRGRHQSLATKMMPKG